MFKRDVKKYSSFTESFNGLVILAQVEKVLKSFSDLSGYQVVQNDKSIVIEPREDNQIEDSYSPQLNTEPEIEEESVVQDQAEQFYETGDVEITEEYIEEQLETQNAIDEEKSTEVLIEWKDEGESPKPKRKKARKYKYPINTNEKLTDDEKEWINRQVRSCEVMQNGQIAYKCPLCETILQIVGSLKKHLRDTHILKSEKDQESWNSRKAFKTEIEQSRLMLETGERTETIWKCQRCETNRIFRSEAGLKVHIRYNHIRSQFIDAKLIAECRVVVEHEGGHKDAWKCPECSKVYSSRDGLRNHIKLEHSDTFSVEQSSDTSQERLHYDKKEAHEDLLNLLKTKRRTLRSDKVASSCKECGIEFINRTAKKEKTCRIHQECHKVLQVVSPFYQLPKCEVTKTLFSNDEDLTKFLTNDERFFEIPTEGMTTKVSKQFRKSTGNAETSDPEAWKCGHCRVSYQTEVECIAHVMILHSKKLVCPIDHMVFEGSRGIGLFNTHMRNRHSDMFPDLIISCTYCRAEFSSVFEKLSHMKKCSEKKFECDHCSRKFFTKIELIRHLKIVSGEISYVCEICSKPCSSTMDLKLHRTAHTNQKSYACSYPHCSKAFKTPAARSSHMETHSNVSYSCSFCPSSFKQRALLQRHLRKGFCRRSPKNSSKKSFIYEEYNDSQMYEVTEVSN